MRINFDRSLITSIWSQLNKKYLTPSANIPVIKPENNNLNIGILLRPIKIPLCKGCIPLGSFG